MSIEVYKHPRNELSNSEKDTGKKKNYIQEILSNGKKSNLILSCANIVINPNNDIKKSSEIKNMDIKNSLKYNKININCNNEEDIDLYKNNNFGKKDVNNSENIKNFEKEDKNYIKTDRIYEKINIEQTENLGKSVINNRKENEKVFEATETNLIKLKEVDINYLNKTQNNATEIINGLEFIVECASDEEFYEESEEKNIKPRTKTVIIREKPNDSEVEASLSETEKSDSYKIIEIKSKKKINLIVDISEKQIKKRGRKKSTLSKLVASESENSTESNSDDEDYSPIARKKVKKYSYKKNFIKSIESKRGRGRPRGRPPKMRKIEKQLLDNEYEQIKGIVKQNTDKKNHNNMDNDSIKSKNIDIIDEFKNELCENEAFDDCKIINDSDNIKNENRRELSQRNIKKIDTLKKFIRTAGIKVHCYETLLKNCKTDAAKAKCLHEFLEDHGIVGRPTLEKCKKLKLKKDTMKKVEELNTKSIISETRSTRGRSTRKCRIELEVPVSLIQKSNSSF